MGEIKLYFLYYILFLKLNFIYLNFEKLKFNK